MLNKLRKSNNNEGFTIIEVMIVLAIAGLIILIVLLAVPALQRNGRNTAIKNDASAVAAAMGEFESNNDGQLPTSVATGASAGEWDVKGAATATPATAKLQSGTTLDLAGTTNPGAGVISVKLKYRCDNTSSPRALAVWYSVETSSAGPSYKCIDA